MVGMLDYHLHYALMATQDRVEQHTRGRIHQLPKHDRPRRLRRRR